MAGAMDLGRERWVRQCTVDEDRLAEETKRAIEAATPSEDVWAEVEALRQEVGRSWQSAKTVVDLIMEQRRQGAEKKDRPAFRRRAVKVVPLLL